MGKGQRTLAPRRRLAGAAFKPPCGAAAGNDADKEKASKTCQVAVVKMSESKPLMKHRNKNVCIKTSVYERHWDQYGGYLSTGHMVYGVKVA